MTAEQMLAMGVLAGSLALFAWGRWRYDLVAAAALLVSVLCGLVPAEHAFAGFAHPAVVTVAEVLVISHVVRTSGLMHELSARLTPWLASETVHVALLTFTVALISAFMNNVAALSLMLPVAIATAERYRRSASIVLMPIAFGSLLGGMTTLIGTPPNLIVSAYRSDFTGEAFRLFDFTPVGIGVALAGVAFVSIGWRLLPRRALVSTAGEQRAWMSRYLVEAHVTERSDLIGNRLQEVRDAAPAGLYVAGVAERERAGVRADGRRALEVSDVLVLRGEPTTLERFLTEHSLQAPAERAGGGTLTEAVVMPRSLVRGRDVARLGGRLGEGLSLVGLARAHVPQRRRLHDLTVEVGDVLLLRSAVEGFDEWLRSIGVLPLAGRTLAPRRARAWLTVGLFAAGLLATASGLIPLTMALLAVILCYVLLGEVRPGRLYRGIEWPVVVLLGAFIPVGEALHHTGVTELLAQRLVDLAGALPAAMVLALILIITMALTEILNNATTALIMAPIAASTAQALGVNVDPFLITVAIGASCAFMTPVGHQSNALVMGPGGYRFGDYWRLGLPLQSVVVVVAMPLVLWWWPLTG